MIYLKLVLMAMCWGSSFVAGKLAVHDMPVFTVSFFRFFFAALIMMVILRLAGKGLYDHPKGFLFSFFTGLTGIFLYNYFFLSSLSLTAASKGSVIVAVNPAITVLFAVFLFRERLTPIQYFGSLISLGGVVLIITGGKPELLAKFSQINIGDILMFIAACCWSTYTLIGRKLLVKVPAMDATFYGIAWGAILLFPLMVKENIPVVHTGTLTAWISILALAVLATVVGFLFFYQGVVTLGAARTVVFIYLVPMFGVFFGMVLLGERPALTTLLGGAVVITGVYLTNKAKKA